MDADRSTVAVYTLPGCARCARALLRRRGISFTEVRGDGVPGFRRILLELTGWLRERLPVGSAEEAAQLAGLLNERAAAA